MIDDLKSIEQGIAELDEAIDAVVGEMLNDPRLQDGGAYAPVGCERGLVELAGQVLTPLRNHWPALVAVVEAAQRYIEVRDSDHHPDENIEAAAALRSALSGLAGRGKGQ